MVELTIIQPGGLMEDGSPYTGPLKCYCPQCTKEIDTTFTCERSPNGLVMTRVCLECHSADISYSLKYVTLDVTVSP